MVAWLWLVVGIVLAIAEAFTTTFVLIMFAAGALAAAAGAAFGAPLWLQLLVFAVVSAGSLIGVRPFLARHLHPDGSAAPMGVAALEGGTGLVLERVDLDHGMIKIDGEMWRARPVDTHQVYEPGERVRIVEIKGTTALVWKE
jgi:membrane protein implicated in regulation of membrane protease activity